MHWTVSSAPMHNVSITGRQLRGSTVSSRSMSMEEYDKPLRNRTMSTESAASNGAGNNSDGSVGGCAGLQQLTLTDSTPVDCSGDCATEVFSPWRASHVYSVERVRPNAPLLEDCTHCTCWITSARTESSTDDNVKYTTAFSARSLSPHEIWNSSVAYSLSCFDLFEFTSVTYWLEWHLVYVLFK